MPKLVGCGPKSCPNNADKADWLKGRPVGEVWGQNMRLEPLCARGQRPARELRQNCKSS